MFFYFITLVNLWPLAFLCFKVYRRADLNLFDFLIIFEAIFFLFIPAFKEIEPEEEPLFRYFIVYSSFNYLLWGISYFIDKSGRYSILNITRFLSRYKDFKINLMGQVLIFLSMIAIFIFYLPTQALVLRFEESRGIQTYAQSSVFLLLAAVYFVVRIIISLIIISDFINKRKNIFNIILFAFFILLALLGVRRDLIFSLLVFLIILYGMKREIFNRKFVIISLCIGLFLLVVYFPFYNIIRLSPVIFDTNRPVESVVEIMDYGIKNYDDKIDNASESTEKRSLGLYNAFYMAVEKNPEWNWGAITISNIDMAIPRILNPNKKVKDIVVNSLGVNSDIADSVLLTSVCEFGLLGGLYAALIFLIVFVMYSLYSDILVTYTSSLLIPVYIMFSLFNMCWNVEVIMTAFFSYFFSSIPMIIFLYLIERFQFIVVTMK